MKPSHRFQSTRWLRTCLLVTLSSFVIRHSSFAAEAPLYIPFQGQVTNQQGAIVTDGQYSVIFNLYDQPVGGQPVWSERHTKIGVTRGMVNVFLGSIAPLTSIDFSQTKYLGITVDTDNLATTADPEMVPRSLILPSFHSMNSNKLAGYDWSPLLADGSNNPLTGFLRGDKIKVGTISADRLDTSAVDALSGTLVQSAPVASFTAMEPINALEAVAVTTDGAGNARVVKANANEGSRTAFYGFAKVGAAAGQPVLVHQYGPLGGFTGLTTGQSYYVGTTSGTISTSGGVAPIYTGHAFSNTVLFADAFGISRRWGTSNYWGNGSDGALSTTGNVDFASVLDGDVVVKQFTNLTINAGHTVTTQTRCRGLVIYVSGDCTINGTLSMTARGANVNPSQANSINPTGIQIIRRKAGGTDTLSASDLGGSGAGGVGASWRATEAFQGGISGNGRIYTILREGGAGAMGLTRLNAGDPGLSVADGTGGGGAGGVDNSGTGGNGAAGTCYSGGAGGGGCDNGNGGAQHGGSFGGAGGSGSVGSGGGAGNPGGGGAASGENGTGGLLLLLVKGNLIIGSAGSVKSEGSFGAAGGLPGQGGGGGGGSGGGRILILHAGTKTGDGIVSAQGRNIGGRGSAGGNGAVTIDQINP
ncbi:MAG: hypothetical protein J0M04_22925 [Verrucomicrobia bacterium]|nr:hypothetical protein [Verrucomicrobiota bacterium]